MKRLVLLLVIVFLFGSGIIYLYTVPKTINKENKMNPANWGIIDKLQGQNNSVPKNSYSGSGGGGWGSTSPAQSLFVEDNFSLADPAITQQILDQQQQTDPYAAWGGTAKYNSDLANYDSQKNTTIQSALEAARYKGGDFKNSILDFVDSQRKVQGKIDNQAINNELAKNQGVSGVQGMVGRGIRSAGVMLGNRNAGSSSAAGAIGNAYGDLGRREMSKVGNQYEMGNREVGLLQDGLNQDVTSYRDRTYGRDKEGIVNGIVESTRSQLSALETAMLGASLPDRIDIQAEIERVKSGALGELAQYDQLMRDQTGSIQAKSGDQRRSEALALQNAGTDLGEGAFDYQSEAPGGFAGGPFASNLPLFTFPRQKRLA